MPLGEWIDVIRDEYLRDFVPKGGAAVKFVVPRGDAERRATYEALRRTSEEAGFVYASVDAAAVRVHWMNLVFNDVARQVDWDALAGAANRRFLDEQRYATGAEPVTFRGVAEANDLDEGEVLRDYKRWLTSEVFRNPELARAFRIAMMRLCQARIQPSSGIAEHEAVHQWLTGDLRAIKALKEARIYQRITRDNARAMLFSLPHWLKFAGHSGLVLHLDLAQLAAVRPRKRGISAPAAETQVVAPVAAPAAVYYSRPGVQEAYELLRQLIDNTDELQYCLVVATTSHDFLDESNKRGVTCYLALKYRVWEDVRSTDHANPLSPLIRISSGDGQT